MGPKSWSELEDLVRKYTGLPFIPDVDHYRIIRGVPKSPCIFIGCTEVPVWEDRRGEYPLCEGHYRILLQWRESVRENLIR